MYLHRPRRFHHSLLLSTALIGLASTLAAPSLHAEDEIRAGAMLQIPFFLGGSKPFFDPSAVRVGLTCQFASVEEDEILTTHYVTETWNGTVLADRTESTSVTTSGGNQVRGVEGNLAIAPFNGFTPSIELLGFYGTNDVQGAFGGGYDFENSFFLDAKVMFPYAEIGLRFPGSVELYGGVRSLGSFDPAKEAYGQDVLTTIVDTHTVTTVVTRH